MHESKWVAPTISFSASSTKARPTWQHVNTTLIILKITDNIHAYIFRDVMWDELNRAVKKRTQRNELHFASWMLRKARDAPLERRQMCTRWANFCSLSCFHVTLQTSKHIYYVCARWKEYIHVSLSLSYQTYLFIFLIVFNFTHCTYKEIIVKICKNWPITTKKKQHST